VRLNRTTVVFMLLACCIAHADKRRDPLTDAEVSQLRATAQEPEKRIPLFIQFAKTRLLAIEQLRADDKLKTDRGKQIHDLLADPVRLRSLLPQIPFKGIMCGCGRVSCQRRYIARFVSSLDSIDLG